MRLGISYVRTIGADLATTIATGRPYQDVQDVVSRCNLSPAQAEALATAGAFDCFGTSRRQALWAAGALAQGRRGTGSLVGVAPGARAPDLPPMDLAELNQADLWSTGLSTDSYPTQLWRARLDEMGIVSAARLAELPHGAPVVIGGIVTHRQRPMTAKGTVFVNLEDETGLVNVICPGPVWQRYGHVARRSAALLVRGKLERADGAMNVLAVQVEQLKPLADVGRPGGLRSRDFH